jgi:hypothetical protein
LKNIEEAIQTLPGSKAHKSWPSAMKAKILNKLGKPDEALETVAQAEKWLYEGYDDEMQNADQAEIKIMVWKSGLDLARAEIYMDQNKTLLAQYYLDNIINQSDPQKILVNRKKEARGMREGIQ